MTPNPDYDAYNLRQACIDVKGVRAVTFQVISAYANLLDEQTVRYQIIIMSHRNWTKLVFLINNISKCFDLLEHFVVLFVIAQEVQ